MRKAAEKAAFFVEIFFGNLRRFDIVRVAFDLQEFPEILYQLLSFPTVGDTGKSFQKSFQDQDILAAGCLDAYCKKQGAAGRGSLSGGITVPLFL
ncbi:MAG: hypothetical protein K2M42_04305 [Oscillospiraceae bacterium]|nr:hypothetical protein [Oscillospiraceae bacterium]